MSLTKEQLELRKELVTATDATAICGTNPYRSQLDVYADKMAEEPEVVDGARAVRMALGNALEEPIMQLLAAERQLVLAPATTERHGILTWLGATPDRAVLDRPSGSRMAVAEAKLVGSRMVENWDEGPPDYVHVQVQVQMTVTRTKLAYVAALLEGTDFRIFEVEHDPDLECAIIEACDTFRCRHLIPRIPPAASANRDARAAFARLYPRHKAGMVIASGDAEVVARRYLDARARAAEAEAEAEAAANYLKAVIRDHEGIDGRSWKATWKTPANGTASWKDIATELGATPALIAQHTTPASRRFLLTEKRSRK